MPHPACGYPLGGEHGCALGIRPDTVGLATLSMEGVDEKSSSLMYACHHSSLGGASEIVVGDAYLRALAKTPLKDIW